MFGIAGTTQDPAFEIGGETFAMYYDVTGEPLRVPVENRSVTPTLETGTIAFMQRVLDGPDGRDNPTATGVWAERRQRALGVTLAQAHAVELRPTAGFAVLRRACSMPPRAV